MASKTSVEVPGSYEKVCRCCGMTYNRQSISICDSIEKFNYLGAGYPLFFN